MNTHIEIEACRLALEGDEDARAECARVIREARAPSDPGDWQPIRDAGHRERLFALLLAGSSADGMGWEYNPRLDSVRDPERPEFATRVAMNARATTERLKHFGYDDQGIQVALERMRG